MCDGVGCEGNSLSMDGGGGIIDCRDWSNSDETTDAIEFTWPKTWSFPKALLHAPSARNKNSLAVLFEDIIRSK